MYGHVIHFSCSAVKKNDGNPRERKKGEKIIRAVRGQRGKKAWTHVRTLSGHGNTGCNLNAYSMTCPITMKSVIHEWKFERVDPITSSPFVSEIISAFSFIFLRIKDRKERGKKKEEGGGLKTLRSINLFLLPLPMLFRIRYSQMPHTLRGYIVAWTDGNREHTYYTQFGQSDKGLRMW